MRQAVATSSSKQAERKDGMKQRKPIALMGTLATLFAGFLAGASTAKAAEQRDSDQVAKLLSEAKTLAFQVKEDADLMEGFTRMNVAWQDHAVAINNIKDHVNALGRQVAKLNDARELAAPWQRTAIDRINPFMEELGG